IASGEWSPGLEAGDLTAVPALQRLFLLDRDKLVDLMAALAEGKDWRGLVRMPRTLLPEHEDEDRGEDLDQVDEDTNREEENGVGTLESVPEAWRPDSCTSPGQSFQELRSRAPSDASSLVHSLSARTVSPRVMLQTPAASPSSMGGGLGQRVPPEQEGSAPQVAPNPSSSNFSTSPVNAHQGQLSTTWRGQSAHGGQQQQQQQRKQRLHRVARCQSTSSVLQQLRAAVRQQPQYLPPTQPIQQQQPAQQQQDPSTPQQQQTSVIGGNSASQLTLSLASRPAVENVGTPDGPSPVGDAPEPAGDAPESLTQQGAAVLVSDGVIGVPPPAADYGWVSGTGPHDRGQQSDSHGGGMEHQQHPTSSSKEDEMGEEARGQKEDGAVGEVSVFSTQPGLVMRMDNPRSPQDAGRTLFQLFTDTSVGTITASAMTHCGRESDLLEQPDTKLYKPSTSCNSASGPNVAGSSGSQITNRPSATCAPHSRVFPSRSLPFATACSNPHPSVQLHLPQPMLVIDTSASSGSTPSREDVMADEGNDAGQLKRRGQSCGSGRSEGIQKGFGAGRSNSGNIRSSGSRSRARCESGGWVVCADTFGESAAMGGVASVPPQSLAKSQQQPSPPRQRRKREAHSMLPSPSVQQRQSLSQELSPTLQRRQEGLISRSPSPPSLMSQQRRNAQSRPQQDRPPSGLVTAAAKADQSDCIIEKSSTGISAVLEAWYEEFPSASLSPIRQGSEGGSGRDSPASRMRTSNTLKHSGDSGLGPDNTEPRLLRDSSSSTHQNDEDDDGDNKGGFTCGEAPGGAKMDGSCSEANGIGDVEAKIAEAKSASEGDAKDDGVAALRSSLSAAPNGQHRGRACGSPLDSELGNELLFGPPAAVTMGGTGVPPKLQGGPTALWPRLPAPPCASQKREQLRKQRSLEHAGLGDVSNGRWDCSFNTSIIGDVHLMKSGNAGVQSPRLRAPVVPKSGSGIPLAQPVAAPTPSPSLAGRNAPIPPTAAAPTGSPASAIPTHTPSMSSTHVQLQPTGPGWLASHASHLSQLVFEVGSASGSGAGSSILHRELLLLATASGGPPANNMITTHGTANSCTMLPTGALYSRDALSTLPRTVSSSFDPSNHLAVAMMQNYWMHNGSTAGLTAAARAPTETDGHNPVGANCGGSALRSGHQPETSPAVPAAIPVWQRPPCSRFRLPQLSESQ
ncbi:hypothetical protein Vretimale_18013, partial [Volvox reticuliferus]